MRSNFLIVAVRAALEAGRKILEIYDTDFSVVRKSDNSPLTMADTMAHRIIKSHLAPTGLPVMSEEGRQIAYEERNQWRRYWIVDPLDGTKEFIKRNGEFTVNIALIEDRRPVLGVISIPVRDSLYFAETGCGSFKIDRFEAVFGPGDPASSVNRDRLKACARRLPLCSSDRDRYIVAGSRSHGSPALDDHLTGLKAKHGDIEFVPAGSSLKFCLVAEGAADHYPRLAPTMEWDTAAGQAIAECAGARVVEYQSSEPLRYNKESLVNPWFIVERCAPGPP
jgi:3'(2'), 5'-bisphosphate nucleotidase